MATIDKAVELLEKVLEENYKLSEGYEIKPETRDEIEEWIKWYNDYKKRGEADNANENSGLQKNLGSIIANFGNMASKANHRRNQQRTNLTWLLCYITC